MPWRNNTITTRLGMWNPPHAVILNILNHCIGLLIMVCTVMQNSGPGLMYTDRGPEDTRAWYQYLHLWQPLGTHSVSFHQHEVSCMYMIEFLFFISLQSCKIYRSEDPYFSRLVVPQSMQCNSSLPFEIIRHFTLTPKCLLCICKILTLVFSSCYDTLELKFLT